MSPEGVRILFIIIIKACFILIPALFAIKAILADRLPEIIVGWSIFIAIVAGYGVFLLGYFCSLPVDQFSMIALYWLFLIILYRFFRPIPSQVGFRGHGISTNKKNMAFHWIIIILLCTVLPCYYMAHSRGIPSNGSLYFAHLDLLKFAEETKKYFPESPEAINFANYPLSLCTPYHGLLMLLGVGYQFQGHVFAFGLLHGLFAAGFLSVLMAISMELWKTRWWGLLCFLMIFIKSPSQIVYSNTYLTNPSKEIATYFLIGLTTLVLIKAIKESYSHQDLSFFLCCGLLLVAMRPYTLPFFLATSAIIMFYVVTSEGNVNFYFLFKQSTWSVLLVSAMVFLWYGNLILRYGSPFPIGFLHQSYGKSFGLSELFKNAFDTVKLFTHFYLPQFEVWIGGLPAKKALNFNEVNLWISIFASIGGISLLLQAWTKRVFKNKAKICMVLVGGILMWLTTALILVPKNRMFYALTPLVLLLAVYGIRGFFIKSTVARHIIAAVVLVLFNMLGTSSKAIPEALAESTSIRLPAGHDSKSFEGSVNYMRLMREAKKKLPGSRVVMTGVEPGLDDFVLTPNYSFWDAVPFPQYLESVFERFEWHPQVCIDYMRKQNLRIISTAMRHGAQIPFLANPSNSSSFWRLIDDNPSVFHKFGSPEGYYHYREVFIVD